MKMSEKYIETYISSFIAHHTVALSIRLVQVCVMLLEEQSHFSQRRGMYWSELGSANVPGGQTCFSQRNPYSKTIGN